MVLVTLPKKLGWRVARFGRMVGPELLPGVCVGGTLVDGDVVDGELCTARSGGGLASSPTFACDVLCDVDVSMVLVGVVVVVVDRRSSKTGVELGETLGESWRRLGE